MVLSSCVCCVGVTSKNIRTVHTHGACTNTCVQIHVHSYTHTDTHTHTPCTPCTHTRTLMHTHTLPPLTCTMHTTPLFQGYPRYSTFDQLNVRNQIALKKILEGDDDDDVSAVRKVKALYRSCINTESINAPGATPLLDLINATGGCVRGRYGYGGGVGM